MPEPTKKQAVEVFYWGEERVERRCVMTPECREENEKKGTPGALAESQAGKPAKGKGKTLKVWGLYSVRGGKDRGTFTGEGGGAEGV